MSRTLALKENEVHIDFYVNKGGTACDRRPLDAVAFYMEKEINY